DDPQAVFDLFMEALEHDPDWEDGAEQLIGAALDVGLDEAGPIELAIEALERLVEKRGDLHKAWEALGHLYYQLQQYTKAVVCLESAQRLDSVRFASHHRLGSAYREIGRFSEAEIMLRIGLAHDPENIPLLNEMGVVLGECARPAEAAIYFQKAVELSPISGAFHANLAVALQRAGMLQEAEARFQSGMMAVDAHWNVYVNYAQFLKEQGRLLDWVRVLFQGIQALVDNEEERIDLATRLVDGVREWIGQEPPEEIKAKGSGWIIGLLESLVELLPGHQSGWVVLSEYYRQDGRHDRAIDCLTRVEGNDPENVWLKVHIGSILAGLGRHDEAVHRFEHALAIEENNQVALANLIMIFALQDRYDQALGLLDRYRQIAFGDPQFTDWRQIAEHLAKGETT
ncbi:MAG: tetratricopeptide repeat protein, partial [Tumebacillaceae bacterium]